MRIQIFLILFACLFLFSCQKELDPGPGNGGGGNGGGGGGATTGKLLIKILQVSVATSDTNIVTCQWNANKRLIEYKSSGVVNGINTDILHTISRTADDKITRIVSINSLGSADSIVYRPVYSGNRITYIIDTQYTFIGDQRDSSALTYNSSGQLISKETFGEFFGIPLPSTKETYTYDSNGNLTVVTTLIAGVTTAMTSYTYDAHASAIVCGEECYVILGAYNVSKNNTTKAISNAVSSGTTYTLTYSQQQYNANNQPTQESLSIVPSGFDQRVWFYYQ